MPLTFFISHASEDGEYAKWLDTLLRDAGHIAITQEFDFRPGHSFLDQMTKARDEADHILALYSPAFFRKTFTLQELNSALVSDGLGRNRTLIPVRIEACEIPQSLQQFLYVDLVGKNESAANEAILKAIQPEPSRPRGRFPGGTSKAADLDKIVTDLRARTRADIEDRCGKIRVLTMEQPIQLGAVYTDVNVLEKRRANLRKTQAEFMQDAGREEFDRFGMGAEKGARVPGLQALDQHLHLMIYGKPGAGKTTFLKRLAMECALGKFRKDLVPVFVTLKAFAEAEPSPTLPTYMSARWESETTANQVLNAGRALVLLDGLDEIRDTDFVRVRKSIEAFRESFRACSIVVTCRIAAREYAFEQFAEVEMADFTEPQIRTFAEGWFGLRNEGTRATAFMEKLKANPPILELASSPLLLTLLCLVFQGRGDFDGTRADLYREGIDVLLRKWDSKRGIERERPYGLSIAVMEDLLRDIAYGRFLASEYFFEQTALEQKIREFFDERKLLGSDQELSPERVLNSIESNLGLLVQRAFRLYSFSHLTFQEYLTAQRVAQKQKLLAEIGPHVGEPRWREVWLLLVTMVDADDIIVELKNRIDSLLRHEPKLQQYLAWCNTRALASGEPQKRAARRAFYFGIALALALALARDLDLALDLALARALDLDLDRALALDLDRALALDLALARALALDLALALARAPALDRAIDVSRGISAELTSELESLRNELSTAVDSKWGRDQWLIWREKLRATTIRHRDIGHDWAFTRAEYNRLAEYYDAHFLLLDCMKAARGLTNKTRQFVEDTMLLPWAEIPKN